ncbi:MAG: N-glycosylase/DNA lyase [Candidatus Aenigmarchaeota archaeon]|nr:N-glycosylase/DNA lyase [Candidatus Aenigmarchaeota archaeon]
MIDILKEKHAQKRKEIENRLQDFRNSWKQDDKHVFGELCFCLLTPQSKAKSCWRTIEKLKETGLLYNGTAPEMKKWMASVRFNENKSKYLVLARELFSDNGKLKVKEKLNSLGDAKAMRTWLVKNVKGMGYKEAGHFLRNVGFGDNIAILDRHILKNLVRYGIIEEIPKSLTEKKYLEIEEKMRSFASHMNIPFDHLDLLWWSEEAGEIFK